MIEDGDIPRSPLTVINWCHPNSKGNARLDCWQDPDDRAYYITQESIAEVLEEEKTRGNGYVQQPTYIHTATEQQPAEPVKQSAAAEQQPPELEQEEFSNLQHPNEKDAANRRLTRELTEARLTIRGKDALIEELQKDRERISREVSCPERVIPILFKNGVMAPFDRLRVSGRC